MELGERLIFLISQPRAGSTMLQQILGQHSQIRTLPEPWLMLHPLYAIRSEGYEAEYDASLASRARKNFTQALPGGENDYIQAIRRMTSYLYERALEGTGKRYFLDKTPRYYFVIPELRRTFPEAHFIILLRNPLAVLNSMLNEWTIFNLNRSRLDLLEAPRFLLEGIDLLGSHCTTIHYEELVADPEGEIKRTCDKIGVAFVPEMIRYDGIAPRRDQFGDKTGVSQYSRPVSNNVEKWTLALRNPQVWRLASTYLTWLGPETVSKMGYAFESLQERLEEQRPPPWRLRVTISFEKALSGHASGNSWWRKLLASLSRSIRKRGVRGTVITTMERIVRPEARKGRRRNRTNR